ncbi:GNAT family N-acetyltransferase [Candidatus Bathyarchaeota archaeon]|nr:GNAT family N-acetyltransferase [Candidatus Bathyarchaeota archaeon]
MFGQLAVGELRFISRVGVVVGMKVGTVIRSFLAKDGRRVVLRMPRWEDLDDLLEMINSLVAERANIIRDEPVSRLEEIDWLSKALCRVEKGEEFYMVAEVAGKVVANSELSTRSSGYDKHVGMIGIAIREGFRDVGIGTEMMKTLIEQGRTIGLKVLVLSAFANNNRATQVYRKVGFKETGRIPRKFFKEGQYVDEVILTMLLG